MTGINFRSPVYEYILGGLTMSMTNVVNKELKNIKEDVLRWRLWELKKLFDHLVAPYNEKQKDQAAKVFYDVVLAAESLEERANKKEYQYFKKI